MTKANIDSKLASASMQGVCVGPCIWQHVVHTGNAMGRFWHGAEKYDPNVE
ncbi:hypothetical protein X755_31955 [Mesorhizobium sp. LNJC405B00]|nr:hypothetical protein X755_31955 [Mesorhizobium sp. LNJC405B00]